jgi:hypothetical protein
MAFFAHPLLVRLSYFPSLDYKPQSATETAFHHAGTNRQTAQNIAMPPLT